jgi:PAS domain S-box-containing protein
MALIFIMMGLIISYILSAVISSSFRKLSSWAERIREGNFTGELEYMTEHGTWEEVQLIKSFNRMHEAIRKHMSELESSREDLKMTLLSIGDGVITVDTDGCVTNMNPIAEALTGWNSTDACGRDVSMILDLQSTQTGEVVKNPVYKVLKERRANTLDTNTSLTSRDGAVYHISDSAAPIFNKKNELKGVILVFRDITHEHKLREQLNQSQKMDAVGQLAGGIAHDFNNMLTGIFGAVELLNSRMTDDKENREFLHLISQSASRAADLTGKLLTFSRKNSIPSTAVSMGEILQETMDILKNSLDKRIRIDMDFKAENDTIIGDFSQLQSIFLNLGINASHAMPRGGILAFSTKNRFLDDDFCRTSSFNLHPGHYIQIQVKDSGMGIPPEILPKIFDPFFTTKEKGKGTGLGLSVAYGTISEHNGMISVRSRENKGSRFRILLPLTDSSGEKPLFSEVIKTGSGTVLLVDDEEIIQLTAKALLKSFGFKVLVAENGKDALSVLKKEKRVIDLVILDMNMPVMNGYDCYYEIRKMSKDLPVILSSGFPQQEVLGSMKKDGLQGFLQKPFNKMELNELVTSLTSKGTGPQ